MSKAQLKQSTILVIIDPQNDFMDTPDAALRVPGATADMERLAGFIDINGTKIDDILVTLDTHVEDHIAHPIRWLDEDDNHPAPFTVITDEMVISGVWRAANPRDQAWQVRYTNLLKHLGGKDLVIWPPHCIKSTHGHRIYAPLMKELEGWMKSTGRTLHTLEKGVNRDTEQYGAFCADVVIQAEGNTHFNNGSVDRIRQHDRQIWTGQTSSHCVMASHNQAYSREAVDVGEERIILTDAMSPVTGFEKMAEDWLHIKRAEGVRLFTTATLKL